MAKVLLEDWKEQYRDERIERMSRDEMSALQSERLVKQVKNVYEHVSFYKKMCIRDRNISVLRQWIMNIMKQITVLMQQIFHWMIRA